MSNINEVRVIVEEVKDWDSNTLYHYGDKVLHDSKSYHCVVENSTTHSFVNSDWCEYTPVTNDYTYRTTIQTIGDTTPDTANFRGILSYSEEGYASHRSGGLYYDPQKDKYFYVYHKNTATSEGYFAKEIGKELFYWLQSKKIGEKI